MRRRPSLASSAPPPPSSSHDVRFQFMNSAVVLERRVSLTYTHSTSLAPVAPKPAIPTPTTGAAVPAPGPPKGPPPSRTALDLTVAFDLANKVSVSHALGSGGCRVKYIYAHRAVRLTTVEPTFDTAKNAWEFAVARRFKDGDAVRGTYQASTRQLGLEWARSSSVGGSFKVQDMLRGVANRLRWWLQNFTEESTGGRLGQGEYVHVEPERRLVSTKDGCRTR